MRSICLKYKPQLAARNASVSWQDSSDHPREDCSWDSELFSVGYGATSQPGINRAQMSPDCSLQRSMRVSPDGHRDSLTAKWANLFAIARIKERGEVELTSNRFEQGGQRMPLFEYRCMHCGQVFEVFTQRRDLLATPGCPECGKQKVERVLSAFSGKTGEGTGCSSSPYGFG